MKKVLKINHFNLVKKTIIKKGKNLFSRNILAHGMKKR